MEFNNVKGPAVSWEDLLENGRELLRANAETGIDPGDNVALALYAVGAVIGQELASINDHLEMIRMNGER